MSGSTFSAAANSSACTSETARVFKYSEMSSPSKQRSMASTDSPLACASPTADCRYCRAMDPALMPIASGYSSLVGTPGAKRQSQCKGQHRRDDQEHIGFTNWKHVDLLDFRPKSSSGMPWPSL